MGRHECILIEFLVSEVFGIPEIGVSAIGDVGCRTKLIYLSIYLSSFLTFLLSSIFYLLSLVFLIHSTVALDPSVCCLVFPLLSPDVLAP